MENWTEVLFSSFLISQIPNLIQNKIEGAKNKGCKPQEAVGYLTKKKNPKIVAYFGNRFLFPKQAKPVLSL
jgi:hypothetical protein